MAVRQDSGATFRMTNVGAAPASVVMNAYDNRVHPGKVDLASGGGPVLRYAFAVIAVAIGASLMASAWRIVAERPVDAVASAVTEATGPPA